MAEPPPRGPPPKWFPSLTLRTALRPAPLAPPCTVSLAPDPASTALVIAHEIDGAWVQAPDAPPSGRREKGPRAVVKLV